VIDFNSIYARNVNLLTEYLIEFKIKMSLEELIRDYTSIFSYSDNTEAVKRFRLIGIKRIFATYPHDLEDGLSIEKEIPSSAKTTRVQLYVLNRKAIESISKDELAQKLAQFVQFAAIFKQLKLLDEFQKEEVQFEGAEQMGATLAFILNSEAVSKKGR
jgi:hypothetical protein